MIAGLCVVTLPASVNQQYFSLGSNVPLRGSLSLKPNSVRAGLEQYLSAVQCERRMLLASISSEKIGGAKCERMRGHLTKMAVWKRFVTPPGGNPKLRMRRELPLRTPRRRGRLNVFVPGIGGQIEQHRVS
jgi:hypothetical protein